MYRHRKASLFTRLIRSIVGLERAEGMEAIVESRDGITPVRSSVKEGLDFSSFPFVGIFCLASGRRLNHQMSQKRI